MQEEKKVSVLVPIYNVDKFLRQCIESIVNQDYKNIDIILVDDCSTDSSDEICDEYAKKDERIKVIHNEKNKGIAEVRNILLSNATGDYIVFIDGDDWVSPDYVSYLLNVINDTESDMAINLVNFTTRDMEEIPEKRPEIWTSEKATECLLYSRISIGCWNKIYKRKFIVNNNIKFLDLYTGEGFRFISDCSQRANHVGVGCKKVYYYRLNNIESATTKYNIRQSIEARKTVMGIKKDLLIKTPIVLNAVNHHIWLNHCWNLRQIISLNKQEEYHDEYINSIKYIKKNAKNLAKTEKSLLVKIKDRLSGLFPVLYAKIQNYIFDFNLKKDVKKHLKNNREK